MAQLLIKLSVNPSSIEFNEFVEVILKVHIELSVLVNISRTLLHSLNYNEGKSNMFQSRTVVPDILPYS